MGHAAPISLDRFRRRTRPTVQPGAAVHPEAHPLVGAPLGALERRYGLMSSEETVTIAEVVATSGDLAIADRLAFLAATERHVSVIVVEFDGWFVACLADRQLDAAAAASLRPVADGTTRIMSVASDRGIVPALGPLATH